MNSDLYYKEIGDRIGNMAVNDENERYIRDALHAVLNSDAKLDGREYERLCVSFTEIKMMSFLRLNRTGDRYGNFAFFADEFIYAVAQVLNKYGVNVSYDCADENIFVNCNFEFSYYAVASVMKKAVLSGCKTITVKIESCGDDVFIYINSDKPFFDDEFKYARTFARQYSGVFLFCNSKGGAIAVIKIAPGSFPRAEIAVWETDFLFDRMSPVYMGLGIKPSEL